MRSLLWMSDALIPVGAYTQEAQGIPVPPIRTDPGTESILQQQQQQQPRYKASMRVCAWHAGENSVAGPCLCRALSMKSNQCVPLTGCSLDALCSVSHVPDRTRHGCRTKAFVCASICMHCTPHRTRRGCRTKPFVCASICMHCTSHRTRRGCRTKAFVCASICMHCTPHRTRRGCRAKAFVCVSICMHCTPHRTRRGCRMRAWQPPAMLPWRWRLQVPGRRVRTAPGNALAGSECLLCAPACVNPVCTCVPCMNQPMFIPSREHRQGWRKAVH